jgi:hypothetical protein
MFIFLCTLLAVRHWSHHFTSLTTGHVNITTSTSQTWQKETMGMTYECDELAHCSER